MSKLNMPFASGGVVRLWAKGELLTALSCLSALKKMSSGDRSLEICCGATLSKDGEGALSFVDSASSFACIELAVVTGGTDLEANLGIGRFEAAGEAWKVGPA